MQYRLVHHLLSTKLRGAHEEFRVQIGDAQVHDPLQIFKIVLPITRNLGNEITLQCSPLETLSFRLLQEKWNICLSRAVAKYLLVTKRVAYSSFFNS